MRTAAAVAVMPCPVCKTGLTLSERQGVEIDYCPSCRGVWLDRGELDKIIERSARDVSPSASDLGSQAPGPNPRRYDDDERGHVHGRRKKSFLSELFD